MKIQMKSLNQLGLKIPKLGMGTWQLDGYKCTDIVASGLDAGYRLIDTAQAYDNEEYVGAGIEQSGIQRKDIFLVSKVWRENLSPDDVINSTKESLDRLKTDYVDLMLIHWPNEEFALEDTLGSMEELLNEGLVKNFGVSNFPVAWLERTQELAPEFVCNQVEFHPFLPQDVVLSWLKKHNKFMMAYSPLARGEVFKNPIIQKIAHKHAVSEAQVVLAWLMEHEAVIAIPKTSTVEHLRSNLESLQVALDPDDLANLSNLKALNRRVINPDFSPKWDEPYQAWV